MAKKSGIFKGMRIAPEPDGSTIVRMLDETIVITVYAKNCSREEKEDFNYGAGTFQVEIFEKMMLFLWQTKLWGFEVAFNAGVERFRRADQQTTPRRPTQAGKRRPRFAVLLCSPNGEVQAERVFELGDETVEIFTDALQRHQDAFPGDDLHRVIAEYEAYALAVLNRSPAVWGRGRKSIIAALNPNAVNNYPHADPGCVN